MGPVGLTFRKSIRLPGGFRINLSKSGVGASWGIPGFRIGTGPGGPRAGVYIPGTGLGWSTSLGGARAPHHGGSGGPTSAGDVHQAARADAQGDATQRVADHDHRLAGLTSLHREASRPLDWQAIAVAPPPASLQERDRWQWWSHLAQGVLAGDREAYEAALHYLSPFPHIPVLGAVEATSHATWLGEARFRAAGREAVPAEDLSLTKTGKLSTRRMGVTRAIRIHQDHVASATLRVARELLALLPFHLVLVHARVAELDSATGHDAEHTVLSAAFPREDLEHLDFSRLDPSDAIERFPHAMEFSTRTGFAPVEEIGLDDLPDEAD
jgi:hypothetical protein